MLFLKSFRSTLMPAQISFFPARPIDSNECKTHDHKYEAERCETCGLKNKKKQIEAISVWKNLFEKPFAQTYLDLWSGVHGFLLSGDDADVKQSRKDEDQTGSSSCPWTHTHTHKKKTQHFTPVRKSTGIIL